MGASSYVLAGEGKHPGGLGVAANVSPAAGAHRVGGRDGLWFDPLGDESTAVGFLPRHLLLILTCARLLPGCRTVGGYPLTQSGRFAR